MLNKVIIKTVPIVLLVLTLLIPPTLSYAWDRGRHDEGPHHYYRYHDRPSFGIHLSYVPEEAFIVRTGGASYYYYDGLYYIKASGDYVLVAPPIGAVVASIPPEVRPVVINGVTYYTDNGVYYVYTRYGYQVVPQPVTVVHAAPVVVSQPAPITMTPGTATVPAQPAAVPAPAPAAVPAPMATASSDESFTVNIPNNKGGYSSVTIKKSGTGFVGPQGEYYSEFPKVTQLQVMYGK